MNTLNIKRIGLAGLSLLIILFSISAFGQNHPTINDTLTSCQIAADKKVTFRLYAPEAKEVKLLGTDIPENEQGLALEKNAKGIWQITVGPLEPGTYRYLFNVDGVNAVDPRNPLTSQSNMNSWSLLHVQGADFMDKQNVPHGMVAELTYYSESLGRFRRLHVYTPPGYESSSGKYPIFYLLHGAWDCDDSWTTVGRAGFIFDNLIAENKIEPMVVVMPAGHVGPYWSGKDYQMDEFTSDFSNDIMPLVEKRYRVYKDRDKRAIAGLSMGGAHTLKIALNKLAKFGYIGVFSSGIFEINDKNQQTNKSKWEPAYPDIYNSEARAGLNLFWFGIGKDDFLLEISDATVEMLRKNDFQIEYKHTAGGHTWHNWRNYLHEFSQKLFQ